MSHLARIALTTALLIPIVALACFTSERARILGKQHPDIDFENLAHHMQEREKIDYDYNGPRLCDGGKADQFECDKVDLAGWLDLDSIGGGSGADNWGWTHIESGRMFALMGRSNGVAFAEVTDPDNPVYLGNLPRPEGANSQVWSDIKTYGNHAFMVADAAGQHGIQVFDLTRLLDVEPGSEPTFDHDALYSEFGSAHNIAINDETGYAYAVGSDTCDGGLHMVNIKQPENPQYAGCFDGDGYTHDVQCVLYDGPDPDYQCREICFASNEDSVTVVDVTDKQKPVEVSRHTYESSYTHQGWLTEDQRYFLADDELDETQQDLEGTRTLIFDFADLDTPSPPAEYIAGGASIDHNQYVIGNYTFQANYSRGLRVLRIDDPATAELTEVAWFDTHSDDDEQDFDGAWSVFPFFGSDTVLVSDINLGLFMLRVTEPNAARALQDALFDDRFHSCPASRTLR